MVFHGRRRAYKKTHSPVPVTEMTPVYQAGRQSRLLMRTELVAYAVEVRFTQQTRQSTFQALIKITFIKLLA